MKESYAKRIVIIFIFFLVFLIIGITFLNIGLNSKKTISLKYQESNNIDYKVYLKENNFFDDEYMLPGKTYITSLIDHIEVDFDYNIGFNDTVDADYKYKIIAKIEANKSDTTSKSNYWTKEYTLVEENLKSIKKQPSYTINQHINVDYNKYNAILNEFKKTLGLNSSTGVLKVYLDISSNVKTKDISTPIKSNLLLKLPLSELAIEASIESDTKNNIKEIKKEVKEKGITYTILTIIGIFSLLLSIFLALTILRSRRLYKNSYKYDLEVDRILSTYDSIIVNIKELPNLEGYNVIKVESFNELIDAHSEIRKPINYYKENDLSAFFLISDNIAWKYIIYKKRKRRIK